MPLLGPATYSTTLTLFLLHWESVDHSLAEPLVLKEGDRAAGLALEARLAVAMAAVGSARMDLMFARATVAEGRAEARSGLERFNGLVRAYWPAPGWPDLLPKLPPAGAFLDKYLRPCREGLRIWQGLEAEPLPPGVTAPVSIGPGLDRAGYAAVVAGARAAGLAQEEAEFALAEARMRRNGVMREARAMLISYTKALPVRLAAGAVLLATMPRLWPLPGHTPEPVVAAGGWTGSAARLEWTECEDALLAGYQVRVCAGPDFSTEDESVVGNVAAGGERVLETLAGLNRPGSVASYRVYVLLK